MRAKMSGRTRRILERAGLWSQRCLQCGAGGRTECHHALQFAGKRVDDPYCCLPICSACHRGNNGVLADPVFCKNALALIAALSHNADASAPHRYKMARGDGMKLSPDQRARVRAWTETLDKSVKDDISYRK